MGTSPPLEFWAAETTCLCIVLYIKPFFPPVDLHPAHPVSLLILCPREMHTSAVVTKLWHRDAPLELDGLLLYICILRISVEQTTHSVVLPIMWPSQKPLVFHSSGVRVACLKLSLNPPKLFCCLRSVSDPIQRGIMERGILLCLLVIEPLPARV